MLDTYCTLDQFPEWHPPFSIIPLFDREECAGLIRLAHVSDRFKVASVGKIDGSVGSDADICSAQLAAFRKGTDVYDFVSGRIRERLSQINARYEFDLYAIDDSDGKLIPYVSILQYRAEDNAHFIPHTDMAGYKGADKRKLSLIVPLNSTAEFKGGELLVDVGRYPASDMAGVGEGIVFNSLTLHGVNPVTEGVRYSLVAFIQGPRFR